MFKILAVISSVVLVIVITDFGNISRKINHLHYDIKYGLITEQIQNYARDTIDKIHQGY